MSSSRDPKQVFISYAHEDEDLVAKLARQLDKHGFVTWIDRKQLEPGSRWSEQIRQAIDNAAAFVPVIGSEPSESTRFEWSEILKRAWRDESTVIVPVLVDEARPPGFLRDHPAVAVDSPASDWTEQVVDHLNNPRGRGVHRGAEGDQRLAERLAELERTAATLAERPDE